MIDSSVFMILSFIFFADMLYQMRKTLDKIEGHLSLQNKAIEAINQSELTGNPTNGIGAVFNMVNEFRDKLKKEQQQKKEEK